MKKVLIFTIIFYSIILTLLLGNCTDATFAKENPIKVNGVYYQEQTVDDIYWGSKISKPVKGYFLGIDITDVLPMAGYEREFTNWKDHCSVDGNIIIFGLNDNEGIYWGPGDDDFTKDFILRLNNPYDPTIDKDKKIHFDTSYQFKYRARYWEYWQYIETHFQASEMTIDYRYFKHY